MKRVWASVFIAAWMMPWSAQAATVVSLGAANGVDMYLFKGDVVQGDADRVIAAMSSAQKAIVMLESDGGNLSEALRVGSFLRSRGFSTAAIPGKVCASACALLWLGGKNKYFSDDSKVGFHAAYRTENGVPLESGIANARIGAYLTELKYSLDVVEFVTAAPPNVRRPKVL